MDPKAYRLPRHAIPLEYHVKLRTRLGDEHFDGSVAIRLHLTEPTSHIELHSRELRIASARLSSGDQVLSGDVILDPAREIARIDFASEAPTGPAVLEVEFAGEVSKGLQGLYVAQDGPFKILVTQSFPTEARTIFPCFDEPDFKARFAYEILTAEGCTVLANSPLSSVRPGKDGYETWVFEATKPMSSYLVAFAVGDLAATPEERLNGTPIRVWAVQGKEHMGRFAHDCVKRLLPYYESYFGIPYHFDKYDQLAAPGFAYGAMENAGLVVFRQPALIMDPATASWEQEKRIAAVVAHEFAHMWFGNLATIKWWDDVWLSEAFAEWFAHKAISVLNPDYEIWDDYHTQRSEALGADSLESAHPIYSHVDTPAQAIELFDAITYLKGCAVLRMLENFLGETSFQAGMQSYMHEFTEGNATNADLWRHLEAATGTPVTTIMESWITQGGYPVLTVSLDEQGLHLAQRRHYSTPRASGGPSPLWNTPVVVRYEDDDGVQEARYLLEAKEAVFPLPTRGEVKWLYANAGDIGFYRQDPRPDVLARLLSNLEALSPAEQMGLLSDQWALLRAGESTISRFLQVLSAVAPLNNRGVVEKVVGHLRAVEGLLEDAGDAEALNNFRTWVGELYAEKLESLGFEPDEGESQNDTQSRVHVLDAMASLAQDPETIKTATRWADVEAREPASVDPNLAPLFVELAARWGDAARFDRHVEIYRTRREAGASPQETIRYLKSFAHFRPPDLVARTLRLLDDGTLPQESIVPVLAQMLERRHSQLAAWEYIKENFERIRAISSHVPGRIVEVTGQLPPEKREDIKSFFDANLRGEAEKSYARALETLDQLAEFRSRTRNDLLAWFQGQSGGSIPDAS